MGSPFKPRRKQILDFGESYTCRNCTQPISDEEAEENHYHCAACWGPMVEDYRAGNYTFPPPPVPTTAWTEADWIAYIVRNGRWL